MMKAVVADEVSAANQTPKQSDNPQVGLSAFAVAKTGGSTSHLPRPAKAVVDEDGWWSVPPNHEFNLDNYDVSRLSQYSLRE